MSENADPKDAKEGQAEAHREPRYHPVWKRVIWFIILWCGAVAVISATAYVIRSIVKTQFPTG